MKIFNRFVLLLLIILLQSSFGFQRIDYRNGMSKNVCKKLRNNVLVYFIFVDTRATSPWTEFDLQSTIDSMEVAIEWLEDKAALNNVPLNIISDYFIGEEFTTIYKNLPEGSVDNSSVTPNLRSGLQELNKWSDNIAKRVGSEVHITEKDGIPNIKNPKNKERLIAHLRDEKQVESVALLFMVNNYFREDISLVVNTMDSEDVEYAIVSYKYPSVIAQNILSLFGAADLYKTLYRKNEKKIKLAASFFPNDIMQDTYAKSINKLEIGEFTSYLIGWSSTLDPKYQQLLTDKYIRF